MARIGILAFGSLIGNPGNEIAALEVFFAKSKIAPSCPLMIQSGHCWPGGLVYFAGQRDNPECSGRRSHRFNRATFGD
jgi:hypothetical protein